MVEFLIDQNAYELYVILDVKILVYPIFLVFNMII